MRRTVRHAAIGGALAVLLTASPGVAAGGAQVGILTCTSIAGTGYSILIHSSVDVECVFRTPAGEEHYKGQMGIGLGVDLAWDRQQTIAFGVVTAAKDVSVGAYSLAGRYVGGKASVTLGVGAGAAALIGGSAKNIALQPLGLESSEGFGLAGGLGYLFLDPAQ